MLGGKGRIIKRIHEGPGNIEQRLHTVLGVPLVPDYRILSVRNITDCCTGVIDGLYVLLVACVEARWQLCAGLLATFFVAGFC